MDNRQKDKHRDGWTAEDFVQPVSLVHADDDPWGDPQHPNESPAVTSVGDGRPKEASVIQGAPVILPSAEPMIADRRDSPTLVEWDTDQASDRNPASDHNSGPEVKSAHHGEPEPIAEYDSQLSSPLFTTATTLPNLLREITVNQWVASIAQVTDPQRQSIAKLLATFSTAKLRVWLPWLRMQEWTAQKLLLFLDFRVYWDERPELWEYLWWDASSRYWGRAQNRSCLNLDDSYTLVERRSHCSPEDVIDEAWLEDWDTLDVWVRVKQRSFSFASFALYRSQLSSGEDWKRRPDLQVDFDTLPDDDFPEAGTADSMSGLRGPAQWFSNQNWYDPNEWHDNLDW